MERYTTSEMKLQLGKRYIRRDGQVTRPLVKNNHRTYPFRDPKTAYVYQLDGRGSCSGLTLNLDIVALYYDTPSKLLRFSEHDVDFAYLCGVFNSSGIDGLHKETQRLISIGKNPHDIIDACRKD